MTTRASRILAGGALVAALALAGCAGSDGGGGDSGAQGDSSSSQSENTDSGADGGEAADNGGKAAGIDLKNPPKAIATLTVPGVPKGDTTDTLIELVKFEERGKLLMAVFRVTPHGTKEKTNLLVVNWKPVLLDPVNLKLYESVNELTSAWSTDLVMNEPNYVMAGFAIPENTDTIDVGVSREGLRMEGVKLP
ncbi:hypothetical protein N802_05315 [Knoellia sinensis KCTC 19936]|uniref:Lipoprotein n=1 Tax=Knoellia sinensis KCTC 19936 TaxID=1385520 RepID=A0A0A0J0Y6_9MICO|nr:hypothetical protein [Knoellia sinensis]KGN31025.1 hypothetical protein N802_05315 [Knoellia sinensis KCTC 19936]